MDQQGTPLSEVLARGPVPTETFARWGADLAGALAAAHAAGAAHGEVRAEAVTVAPDGTARLHAATPDHPADVYALGALLHVAGGRADPRLAALWGWLGHPDPAQRPTAAQVARQLQQLVEAPPDGPPSGPAQRPAGGPAGGPPSGPAHKPAGGPAGGPAHKPAGGPAGGPAHKPAGRPADGSAGGPAHEPPGEPPHESPAGPAHEPPADPPHESALGEPKTAGEPSPAAEPNVAAAGRRRGPAVVALAVVVVLAVALAGWWLAGRPHPGAATNWANPIGDVRTADPCTVLNSDALQRFGATRLDPNAYTPATCFVLIRPPTGERIWLSATLSEPWRDDHDLAALPRQTAGPVTIYQAAATGNHCGRILQPPDRFRVDVAVNGQVGRSGLDLCTIADAAVGDVLAALARPELPRRTLTGPPNSLVWLSSCDLADEAMLRTVPGLDPARANRTQGGWFCEWGDDPARADPPRVWLSTGSTDAANGEVTTIAGRSARVMSGIWNGPRQFCQIALMHRRYQDTFGEPRMEALFVAVHLNVAAPPETQCSAATTIAQAAAAKLPPAN